MIFNSLDFLIFFAVVLAAYFFIPQKVKWVFLLAASYYFYAYKGPFVLVYLVAPTLLVYFITRSFADLPAGGKKKLLLILGLASALSVLLVFKYTDFVGGSIYGFIGLFKEGVKYEPFKLLWPIGVSFYSFKLVSYLMDVYNENAKAEKHLGYFALYVSFFPQILAGPIDRAVKFIPELKQNVYFDMERILSGARLVVWGLFKKMVMADRLAVFVGEVFKAPEQQGINLIFGAYFYAFQIYCDFSGYSDMAIGISRILGFKSMDNFDFPYFANTMTQFWNKWHISLSTWLRDYLFLPIAYAVMRPIKTPRLWKIKAEAWGYAVGMFITMFLGGLWHGASWNFVIWGMLHGVFLVFGYSTKKFRKRMRKKLKLNQFPKLHSLISMFITFNLVSFAWIFFRAETFAKAVNYIKHIQFKFTGEGAVYLIFNIVLLTLFILMEIIYKNKDNFKWVQRVPMVVKVAGFALFICLIIIFSVDTANEFIYFQF